MSAPLFSDPWTGLWLLGLVSANGKGQFFPRYLQIVIWRILCFKLCSQTQSLLGALHLNSDNCGAKQKPPEETTGSRTGMERMSAGKTDRIAL